ncbi:hypothetical protein [Flavobacterium sp. HNIBRBA15423]|uniref:hypothetical protein n=1 Tax=Flavobacterium sp. HNIBRBA15423 TaxID=3458683 RepID=UPI004044B08D
MKLIIRNSNTVLESEKFDIIIPCENSSKLNISYVDFEFEENSNPKLFTKFFLNENTDEITDFNFYHIEDTNLLFFRFVYQWGIIDLKTRKLKRNITDMSVDFPFFYFHENCILIVDDLFAETITLDGFTIDRIGNEQPHEITEFKDYFEFDIIGVEKRKLMKKTTTNSYYNGFGQFA